MAVTLASKKADTPTAAVQKRRQAAKFVQAENLARKDELVSERALRAVFDRTSLTRSNKRYNECNEGNEAEMCGKHAVRSGTFERHSG